MGGILLKRPQKIDGRLRLTEILDHTLNDKLIDALERENIQVYVKPKTKLRDVYGKYNKIL